MNEVLTTVLKDTYSLTFLKHRLRILKSYLSSKIFGGEAQDELSAQDSTWLSSLPRPLFEQFNKNNFSGIFSELEEEISTFKILTMYLPFDTDEQTLAQIGEFARKKFNSLIVLDMKFDPNLIAGCALSWGGIYKDYSLRSQIDQRKGEILESFKKFLR